MSETLYMFEDVFEASRNTIVFTFPDLFFLKKACYGCTAVANFVYTCLNHRLDRTQLGQNRDFSLVLGHAVLLIYIILLPDYFIFWCTVLVRYYNIF